MLILLHGVTGGWDELIIAVVALGVLWLAVKLAGRKPGAEDDETDETESTESEQLESARPPATPLGQ
jgi:hypothetical protein